MWISESSDIRCQLLHPLVHVATLSGGQQELTEFCQADPLHLAASTLGLSVARAGNRACVKCSPRRPDQCASQPTTAA